MQGLRTYGTHSDERGFTFAEMLVTISIFSIVIVAIVGIFISVLTVQRKVAGQRKLQQNIRFAVEEMVRDIRSGKIDYTAQQKAAPPFTAATELHVITQDGNNVTYSLSGGQLLMDAEELTGTDVQINTLKFYITPDSSPYLGGTADSQSRVTIYVDSESTVLKQKSAMTFQTTVTSRIYER
ncbi:prepilin-type N-terminal cleavage/methylation domain-containing protein [Patescibacteria group bacterium]|nr:prepilin-type N-terminal cleavage/methylation domain-containing protein [Patescibacteria group bacterium]